MNTHEFLAGARKQTDRLFDLVRSDALYERPIPERHRIVFYLGHLEAFDWNLLRKSEAFHPHFDRLFAFGIDPVDGGLPTDTPSDWPAVDEICAYNTHVRATIDDAAHDPELLSVALEHRLMHAETLAYMLHQLPLDLKSPQPQVPVPDLPPPANEPVEILGGCATLGLANDGSFGWDNEFDRHQVFVPRFTIDRYKVSNAEYLQFVEAGGYEDRTLWTDAAWQWKADHRITHPVFWKPTATDWRYRGMFEEIPLPATWPVYVSHAEAAAYARWSGARLPTEAEWHRAAYSDHVYPWGDDAPSAKHGYFHFERWDPAPVHAFPAASSRLRVEGLLANGWEWTATPFAPFHGFQPRACYPGYSANFFDGQHYVLKGGSTRTDACMLRPSFRNWFQPHYQYVYAGFRCAAGNTPGV
jgi:ergothioneine biosynthesis protein EgtB